MHSWKFQVGFKFTSPISWYRGLAPRRLLYRPIVGLLVLFANGMVPVLATPPEAVAQEGIVTLVKKIQKADYEGDLEGLKKLHDELMVLPSDKRTSSRVLYWQGFALWRRAINGNNEDMEPKEMERDLMQGFREFEMALEIDPTFFDARIGALGSLGLCLWLNQKNPTRMQELIPSVTLQYKKAKEEGPDHPRFLWVIGPTFWASPPERGGGQEKAIAGYKKGLEAVWKMKKHDSDSLEPAWGEPELMMNLAWSNLNKTTPDLHAAEQYARFALCLVPNWHYVRDILMPQILKAKEKAERLHQSPQLLPSKPDSAPSVDKKETNTHRSSSN